MTFALDTNSLLSSYTCGVVTVHVNHDWNYPAVGFKPQNFREATMFEVDGTDHIESIIRVMVKVTSGRNQCRLCMESVLVLGGST